MNKLAIIIGVAALILFFIVEASVVTVEAQTQKPSEYVTMVHLPSHPF